MPRTLEAAWTCDIIGERDRFAARRNVVTSACFVATAFDKLPRILDRQFRTEDRSSPEALPLRFLPTDLNSLRLPVTLLRAGGTTIPEILPTLRQSSISSTWDWFKWFPTNVGSSFLPVFFLSCYSLPVNCLQAKLFGFLQLPFFTFDHNLGILPCIAVSWMMLSNVLLYDLFCRFFTRYF